MTARLQRKPHLPLALSTLLVAACSGAGPPTEEPSSSAEPTTTAAALGRNEATGARDTDRAIARSANTASSPDGTRVVECDVRTGGARFHEPCLFRAEEGGSFSLGSTDQVAGVLFSSDDKDFPDIVSVSVSIVAPGEAEVRGVTSFGVNSRWGRAIRSAEDPACWVGEGFRICAR